MLHKNKNPSNSDVIDSNKLDKLLMQYLQEGMAILAKRRDSENLIIFSEYIQKYGTKVLQEKFAIPLDQLRRGYTNSKIFRVLTEYVSYRIDGVELSGSPDVTYILQEGKNPTDFIHDLFFNPEVVTVADDMLAINAAKYYAFLMTLQVVLGKDEAELVFNDIFNLSDAKMLVSSFRPKMGDRTTCVNSAGFTSPLNPMAYFIRSLCDGVSVGNIMCYQNYPEFRMKFPWGHRYAAMVICVVDNPIAKYLSFYSDGQLTEEEILQIHKLAYNAPKPKWMYEDWAKNLSVSDSGSNNPCRRKIKKGTPKPPGFKNQNGYRFDTEKILALIFMRQASIKKFKTHFVIENKAIKQIRETIIKSMLKSQGRYDPANIKITLSHSHYIADSCKTIDEDYPEVLQKKKLISFDLAWKHYQQDKFKEAAIFYVTSLAHSRSIYHYFARMHGKNVEKGDKKKVMLDNTEEMLEAEKQIAIACYNLSAALRENNQPKEAIPYLEEAREICDGFEVTEEYANLIKTALIETERECAIANSSHYGKFSNALFPHRHPSKMVSRRFYAVIICWKRMMRFDLQVASLQVWVFRIF